MPQFRALLRSPAVDQFGDHPRPGDHDGAELFEHAHAQQVGGEGVGALGWVEKEKMASRGRGTVGEHGVKRPVDQLTGQLLWIANGRGAGDVGRLAAVVRTNPVEPAEQVQHMRAKDAAVGVQFVDHHVFQLREKTGTRFMKG